jgi:hypothetical protein
MPPEERRGCDQYRGERVTAPNILAETAVIAARPVKLRSPDAEAGERAEEVESFWYQCQGQ